MFCTRSLWLHSVPLSISTSCMRRIITWLHWEKDPMSLLVSTHCRPWSWRTTRSTAPAQFPGFVFCRTRRSISMEPVVYPWSTSGKTSPKSISPGANQRRSVRVRPWTRRQPVRCRPWAPNTLQITSKRICIVQWETERKLSVSLLRHQSKETALKQYFFMWCQFSRSRENKEANSIARLLWHQAGSCQIVRVFFPPFVDQMMNSEPLWHVVDA